MGSGSLVECAAKEGRSLKRTRGRSWVTMLDDLRERFALSRRVLAMGAAVVLVLAAAGVGSWLWFESTERRALAALGEVLVRAQASQQPEASPDSKQAALRELEEALQRYPSATLAPRVAYELGNLKYQLQRYAEARATYEIAARGASSETVRRLARLGIAYTWEAERNYAQAVEVLQSIVTSLQPGDFLYEELLIDLARVQERQGRRDDAIRTYRRILENPKSLRADDVRSHLARLGAGS
jgi:tetratricopeptide (TPR) repeat protein